MLRKRKDKFDMPILNDPVTIKADVTIHLTDIQISLNEYLARHNRNRNLDKAITSFCHKQNQYFNTKEKWDNIIIEFFS